MSKIICPWIMCKFNSCEKREGKGRCKKDGLVELKVKNIHEIRGFEDAVPDELEDACLLKCDSFLYSNDKAEKLKLGIK